MPPLATLTDLFASDLFKVTTLTDALNKLPYKPSRIGQLGLFQDTGVPTTTIVIEERSGKLHLLPSVPRGGPASKMNQGKRTARAFSIPHIPVEDEVLADDLLNVRAFGSDDRETAIATTINERQLVMRQSHEVTLEFLRLGALKGVIIDGDGSTTLYNLFTEFGIAQTQIDFALSNDATDVRAKCLAVKRAMEAALGAMGYDHVHCLCGKTFFENLISHPIVYATYEIYMASALQRADLRKGFEFCGIVFEEYPGTVSGTQFVADAAAHFFPVGVPGLFRTYFAPADFVEAVGTIGIPLYSKAHQMKYDRGIELHTQSNPLTMCTIPGVLVAHAL